MNKYILLILGIAVVYISSMIYLDRYSARAKRGLEIQDKLKIVEIGMTDREVINILGKPDQTNKVIGANSFALHYEYYVTEAFCSTIFLDSLYHVRRMETQSVSE